MTIRPIGSRADDHIAAEATAQLLDIHAAAIARGFPQWSEQLEELLFGTHKSSSAPEPESVDAIRFNIHRHNGATAVWMMHRESYLVNQNSAW